MLATVQSAGASKRDAMGKVKIPYYTVINGYGYWRPKPSICDEYGFGRIPCGKDGPAAWKVAQSWADKLRDARLGRYTAERKYPKDSIGEAFTRYRKTDVWADKAARTREEWERVWAHIEPLLGDVKPQTLTLEDLSAIRSEMERSISLREAHRVIKVWRALWLAMASLKYCEASKDPSLGIRNYAPMPRSAMWVEGEAVRLCKRAWRSRYYGLAAMIAVAWDTQFSPVDVRKLTASQLSSYDDLADFLVERAKTGRSAIGTLGRRATAILRAYVERQPFEPLTTTPIFRNRSGRQYSKDTLGDDFRAVRLLEFGPGEKRTLADFRRSGAIEALAGGADATTVSAKMGNTLSASNELHRTYTPVEITKVRAADEARRIGRSKLRGKRTKSA